MAFDHDRVRVLFEKLDRQLSKLSSKPQPNNIHQFRTAARRLETVLCEVIPDQDRKQRRLLKLLTKLRRRAGKVRDLDVQIAALRSLKVSERPGLKTQILQTMAEMRAKRERRLLDVLDKETVRELRRRLKRERVHFFDSSPNPWALAENMLSAFTSQNGAAVNESLLHHYRIVGKKIRYIAEFAGDQPGRQQVIEELKRMQDVLGEWHDWITLNETVRKLLSENVNSPLLAAIGNITRAKYRDAVQAVFSAKQNLVGKSAPDVPPGEPIKRNTVAAAAAAHAVA
jgi:CHAD domain-containing protein